MKSWLASFAIFLVGCPAVVSTNRGDAADAMVLPDHATPGDVPRPDGGACTLRYAYTSSVDLLFEVDNSNSMKENQRELARQFPLLINQLVNPPPDPATGAARAPVRSLHVGVISSDLGTPGSTVPSCAHSDGGDQGLLNPIHYGPALRTHEPWTTSLLPGTLPARCEQRFDQYPAFLSFTAGATGAVAFAEDFVCNAFLSAGGCGLEQQLESAYRALVTHDPRERPGNLDPNAGFVRDGAVLAIVILSDEEDMSVRDCRYAERGRPCTDALTVFDSASSQWSSTDLNLRAYLYRPGNDRDPTWPLDRYIDTTNPTRGFLSLKPGHPERVVFGAIAGVPITLPMAGTRVDWATLLGRDPAGADGYVAMSPEGPVSMRQANPDPSCPTRVVPGCRRQGSAYDPTHPPCDSVAQYFAWPSRRLAQVARRFDEAYRNGVVSSICRTDFSDAMRRLFERIQIRLCD